MTSAPGQVAQGAQRSGLWVLDAEAAALRLRPVPGVVRDGLRTAPGARHGRRQGLPVWSAGPLRGALSSWSCRIRAETGSGQSRPAAFWQVSGSTGLARQVVYKTAALPAELHRRV